jgi:uncharacterized glyoxalase superfamily protein PhnB
MGGSPEGRLAVRAAPERPVSLAVRSPLSALGCDSGRMTSIQPELWVERAGKAVAFCADAFGARVLHQAGQGDDPDAVVRRAIDAGATEKSAVCDEHGWRLGRIVDPFGHEWEIGKPIGPWPPP